MLEVLDTAGEEEYTALRDQWIRDGEGFVLVYSISSRASFSRIKKFHHQIQRVKESAVAGSPTFPGSPLSQTMSIPPLGPAPVMLVGNKCDRVTEREVSTQEGSALAKQLNCEFVEASAKSCVNVEKAFFDVVRQLRKQRANLPSRQPTSMQDGMYQQRNNKVPRTYAYEDGVDSRKTRYRRERKAGSKCVIL